MSSSDLDRKIREQVEFYFSDSNLPKDKFLRSLVANNPEGYVELKTIASFNRMKSLTTDMEVIVNAIKKSSMLEVDSEGKLVRRVTTLPDTDTSGNRTLHVKGLPTDEQLANIDTVKDFFNKFGQVTCVRLRREKGGQPKGSAFVEFDSESVVNDLASKTDIKFNESDEKPLLLETKNQHLERKKKEREEKRKKDKEQKNEEEAQKVRDEMKNAFYLSLEGIEPTETFTFNTFKQSIPKEGLKFVDYPLNDDKTKAIIRLENSESLENLKKQIEEGKTQLPGKLVAKSMSDEERDQYIEGQVKMRLENNPNKRKGGFKKGGFKGNRNNNKKKSKQQ
ncbi:hypothetical protein ABK040_016298 [Willaertia magna]